MTKRYLVFQHMDWEGPGIHLLRSAEKLGVEFEVLEVWHQPIPDLSPYDGLFILGGSPNVDQENVYPFLRVEKTAIRHIVENDKSYLGFCLGHQLLADVLGAKVGPNTCRSVGRGGNTRSFKTSPTPCLFLSGMDRRHCPRCQTMWRSWSLLQIARWRPFP
jgi:GMP synthase-like glutamine amidotransferase